MGCAGALLLLFAVGAQEHAPPVVRDTALAAGEFRRGVLAYYRGAFNDAIQLDRKSVV